MKLFLVLLAVTSLFSNAAFASHAPAYASGVIESKQEVIRVVDEAGTLKEYKISAKDKWASLAGGRVLNLSEKGGEEKCGHLLGTLAQDYSMQFEIANMKVTFKASQAEKPVAVYGMCDGDLKEVNDLQIENKAPVQADIEMN